jgi:hypothetical protein
MVISLIKVAKGYIATISQQTAGSAAAGPVSACGPQNLGLVAAMRARAAEPDFPAARAGCHTRGSTRT